MMIDLSSSNLHARAPERVQRSRRAAAPDTTYSGQPRDRYNIQRAAATHTTNDRRGYPVRLGVLTLGGRTRHGYPTVPESSSLI